MICRLGVIRLEICFVCRNLVAVTDLGSVDMLYRWSVSCQTCGWSEGFFVPVVALQFSTDPLVDLFEFVGYIVRSAILRHSSVEEKLEDGK